MTLYAPIVLSPRVGGFSVGYSGLNEADIIVSTTTNAISFGIRVATNSVVSHAALYCGSGSVIEAIRPQVVSRSIDDSSADDVLAVAYRSPHMTPRISASIIKFASLQIRKKYDLEGALFARDIVLCEIRDAKATAFFCSELILESYKQGGLPLVPLPSQCYTPDDVARIGVQRLIYAGHLKGNTSWFPVISP